MKKKNGSSLFFWVILGAIAIISNFGDFLNTDTKSILSVVAVAAFPVIIAVMIIGTAVKNQRHNITTSKDRPMIDTDNLTRIDGKIRPFGQNPSDSMFSSLNDYDTKYYKAGRIDVIDPWDIKDEKPPWEL